MHNDNLGPMRLCAAIALAAALAMPAATQAQVAVRLASYNVDPASVSVSGLSSGANMAIQIAVAHSSSIMGVGVFSGVPYDCLRAGNATPQSCVGRETPVIEPLASNMLRWSGREIDDVANLARQRVYAYVGKHDTDYSGSVVNQTARLFRQFAAPGNVLFVDWIDSGHTVPTDFDNPNSSGAWKCSSLRAPMSNCDYDGAGAMLRHIYGPLAPRNAALPTQGYMQFDQTEFVARTQGMHDIGLLYVPPACEAGAPCRLHVFMHSCGQGYFDRNNEYIPRFSGHTRWAETNNIIVLFPQTWSDPVLNPNGCWDDQGIFDDRFDQKGGIQIEAIMAMVKRITDGYQGGPRAVEYHHAAFGHYFVTSLDDEIAAIDAGKAAGWLRTGETFGVYAPGTPGTLDVCRFFSGEHYVTVSTHFYTTDAAECASLMTSAIWQYEGVRFALKPTGPQGGCAVEDKPLYRLYNGSQGGVPNHRYTTSAATRAAMIAAGWIPEGNGDLGVIGCTPQ